MQTLEREKGFEPSTCCLGSSHSAAELLPHDFLVNADYIAGSPRHKARIARAGQRSVEFALGGADQEPLPETCGALSRPRRCAGA